MNSVAALDEGPRRHIVNYRETLAPGEIVPRNPWVLATKLGGELAPIEYPLPAVGLDLAFRLQTGPKPVGRDVRVIIGLESDSECDVYRPSVRVNGVPCSAADEKGEQGLFEFTVPEAAKADEEHVVGICGNTHVGGKFLKVTRVEFAVGPQKA
jgi:hypothetical protein